MLMGPSAILGLIQLKFLFFIGQICNGLGTGMILTPMLPEIMESIYQKEGIIEGEDENLDAIIADKASALYFTSFSLGVIIAPPTGGLVYDTLFRGTTNRWQKTCDVFGIAAGIFTAAFLIFNVLPDISKEKENENEMKEKIINSQVIKTKLLLGD